MFFGELSLSGDVRPAPQAELRLKEAAKLGFTRAYVPEGTKIDAGLQLIPVKSVHELLAVANVRGAGRKPRVGVVE